MELILCYFIDQTQHKKNNPAQYPTTDESEAEEDCDKQAHRHGPHLVRRRLFAALRLVPLVVRVVLVDARLRVQVAVKVHGT